MVRNRGGITEQENFNCVQEKAENRPTAITLINDPPQSHKMIAHTALSQKDKRSSAHTQLILNKIACRLTVLNIYGCA